MHRCVRSSLLVLGLFSCLFLVAELVRTFDQRARGVAPARPPAPTEAVLHSHAATASHHTPPPSYPYPSTGFAASTTHLTPSPASPSSPTTSPPLTPTSFSVMAADESDDLSDFSEPSNSRTSSTGPALRMAPASSSTALPAPHAEHDADLPPSAFTTSLTPSSPSSSSAASQQSRYRSPWSRWSRRYHHLHHPHPYHPSSTTPCPVSDSFNITARLTQLSHIADGADPTTTILTPTSPHHHHYTVVLTSHTVHLDWVHVHLAVNSSDSASTTRGTFHMERGVHEPVSGGGNERRMVGRMGRVWEHRVQEGLSGTEEVELAFTFHVNRTTCDTQARITPLHSLLTSAELLTPADSTASALHGGDDPVAYVEEEAKAEDEHAQLHGEDVRREVEALVDTVVDSAFTSAMQHPQQVAMVVDALGHALPAYPQHPAHPTYEPQEHPYHQHHAHAHHHEEFDPAHAYGVDTGMMADFADTQRGGGVADGCAAADVTCQVTAMCQACFSYERPALCSPCASILQCHDRLCAHQAVSSPASSAHRLPLPPSLHTASLTCSCSCPCLLCVC